MHSLRHESILVYDAAIGKNIPHWPVTKIIHAREKKICIEAKLILPKPEWHFHLTKSIFVHITFQSPNDRFGNSIQGQLKTARVIPLLANTALEIWERRLEIQFQLSVFSYALTAFLPSANFLLFFFFLGGGGVPLPYTVRKTWLHKNLCMRRFLPERS